MGLRPRSVLEKFAEGFMLEQIANLESRLGTLEKKSKLRTRSLVLVTVVLAGTVFIAGWSQRQTGGEVLRVRGLIVEDADGRARIILGSPIPDRNQGGNARTGIIINDASEVERLGLSLQNNGRMVMGFDAPLGKGDDRNRERVTIVADENGGAYIRFLDRRTLIPARLYLDDNNRVSLELNDIGTDQIIRRRIRASGDETTKEPR